MRSIFLLFSPPSKLPIVNTVAPRDHPRYAQCDFVCLVQCGREGGTAASSAARRGRYEDTLNALAGRFVAIACRQFDVSPMRTFGCRCEGRCCRANGRAVSVRVEISLRRRRSPGKGQNARVRRRSEKATSVRRNGAEPNRFSRRTVDLRVVTIRTATCGACPFRKTRLLSRYGPAWRGGIASQHVGLGGGRRQKRLILRSEPTTRLQRRTWKIVIGSSSMRRTISSRIRELTNDITNFKQGYLPRNAMV